MTKAIRIRRQFGTFTADQIAEANVVLDALLSDRLFTDPACADLRAIARGLLRTAWEAYREKYPLLTAAGRDGDSWRRWTAQIGMRSVYRRGEHDYVCLFCRTDVATLGSYGGRLPPAFVRKLERHGTECAMRFVMGVAEPRGPVAGSRRNP